MAITSEARALLTRLMETGEADTGTVTAARFRADHANQLDLLDQLVRDRYILQDGTTYRVGLTAVPQLDSHAANALVEHAECLWKGLRNHYLAHLNAPIPVEDLAAACGVEPDPTQRTLRYMLDAPWWSGWSPGGGQAIQSVAAGEIVLKHATFCKLIEEVASWNAFDATCGFSPRHPEDKLADVGKAAPERSKLAHAHPVWLHKLPVHAEALMREVHVAIDAELHALAAMGIRATIDVVSVDLLSGDYGTFKEKLDGLVNEGHFTRSQQGTFIAVVEAGNAASHRGFIPDRESVMAMLEAVQHMLVSAYVLPGSAKSLLASTPKRPPKLRG